jgi:hypothetical protein
MSVSAYRIPKYRIGNSGRIIGSSAVPPEGFILLNLSDNNCYIVSGGLWTTLDIIPNPIVIVFNLSSNVSSQSVFTFYVDPISGSDSNTGLTKYDAWLTTEHSDLQILLPGQTIGYLQSGSWVLYRTLNMTVDQTNMTADNMTAGANQF